MMMTSISSIWDFQAPKWICCWFFEVFDWKFIDDEKSIVLAIDESARECENEQNVFWWDPSLVLSLRVSATE